MNRGKSFRDGDAPTAKYMPRRFPRQQGSRRAAFNHQLFGNGDVRPEGFDNDVLTPEIHEEDGDAFKTKSLCRMPTMVTVQNYFRLGVCDDCSSQDPVAPELLQQFLQVFCRDLLVGEEVLASRKRQQHDSIGESVHRWGRMQY